MKLSLTDFKPLSKMLQLLYLLDLADGKISSNTTGDSKYLVTLIPGEGAMVAIYKRDNL